MDNGAMNYIVLISLGILFCATYFGLGILKDYLKNRYKDQRAEFTSDVQKLRAKWNRKGCYDYADGLEILIKGFWLPNEDPEPSTEYGKEVKRKLTDGER